MNNDDKDEKGFTIVELLLFILALAIVGAVGYYVAKHLDAHSNLSNTQSEKTSSTTSKKQSYSTIRTSAPTKQLSYDLPSDFKTATTDRPTNPTATQLYQVDISSHDLTPRSSGLPCDVSSCQEPIDDISIQVYLPAANQTLQQFYTKVDGSGLSGEYTELDGQPAYCQQQADNTQKQLASLPFTVPWQVFWGSGCAVDWQHRIYQVNVIDRSGANASSPDFMQAVQLVESLKFTK